MHIEILLEKVIFFLKLWTFYRKHVPIDCNLFSKIASPRFTCLTKFGLAHSCLLILILDCIPWIWTLRVVYGRFIGKFLQEIDWKEVRGQDWARETVNSHTVTEEASAHPQGDGELWCSCRAVLDWISASASYGCVSPWEEVWPRGRQHCVAGVSS